MYTSPPLGPAKSTGLNSSSPPWPPPWRSALQCSPALPGESQLPYGSPTGADQQCAPAGFITLVLPCAPIRARLLQPGLQLGELCLNLCLASCLLLGLLLSEVSVVLSNVPLLVPVPCLQGACHQCSNSHVSTFAALPNPVLLACDITEMPMASALPLKRDHAVASD